MVEAVGVEPTSESPSQSVSPSAVNYLGFGLKLQLTGFSNYIAIDTPSVMATCRVSFPTEFDTYLKAVGLFQ